MARKRKKPGNDADRRQEGAGGPDPQSPPAPAGRADYLPPPESILGESDFTSPKGFKYKIIHSNEQDASDEGGPPKKPR